VGADRRVCARWRRSNLRDGRYPSVAFGSNRDRTFARRIVIRCWLNLIEPDRVRNFDNLECSAVGVTMGASGASRSSYSSPAAAAPLLSKEVMHRVAFLVIALPALLAVTGCARTFYFVGRSSGVTATTTVPAGHPSNAISFTLEGKTYTGRYAVVAEGGSIGFGNTFVTAGTHSAVATGMFTALPTQGNGTIIASAPDGSTIHCVFDWSQMSRTGVGVCQDNRGEVYDLQID
jgi:hypothetical protein